MKACSFCHPHADPRKQRHCHVGAELFAAYRDVARRFAELAKLADPPTYSFNAARAEMQEARKKYRLHTDGGE